MKGTIRKIDECGRVVIPKSLRLKFDIDEGDDVEIFSEGDNIVIRKKRYRCVFCSSESGLVEYKGKCICRRCIELLNS